MFKLWSYLKKNGWYKRRRWAGFLMNWGVGNMERIWNWVGGRTC